MGTRNNITLLTIALAAFSLINQASSQDRQYYSRTSPQVVRQYSSPTFNGGDRGRANFNQHRIMQDQPVMTRTPNQNPIRDREYNDFTRRVQGVQEFSNSQGIDPDLYTLSQLYARRRVENEPRKVFFSNTGRPYPPLTLVQPERREIINEFVTNSKYYDQRQGYGQGQGGVIIYAPQIENTNIDIIGNGNRGYRTR